MNNEHSVAQATGAKRTTCARNGLPKGPEMRTEDFVANVVKLKQELLEAFVAERGTSQVAQLIVGLGLSPVQQRAMRGVLDAALRDTLYTVLVGLDGAASIGGNQQSYALTAEDGSLVYKPGELEAEAWRQLQNDA